MSLANKKILIVDDMEDIRDIYRDVFEDEGAFVYVAGDGQEALDNLNRKRIDLIITDIIMPGMDGNELMVQAKKQTSAKILAISAGGNGVSPDQALMLAKEQADAVSRHIS